MTHYYIFSIIGGHIKNAEREIDLMHDSKNMFVLDKNYGAKEYQIFNENVRHGILALYSLNAGLESLIAFLDKELGVNSKDFYSRIKKLEKKGIITDIDSLSKCIELRKQRNIVTHWEENTSQLYGSDGYLPFLFGDSEPREKSEELISSFNKVDFMEYLDAFNQLFDNILKNIPNNKNEYLIYCLKNIKEGYLFFE